MQQRLAFGGREGLQVGDDGASVFAIEVIPVHGRAEGFAVRAQAFFEQVFHLCVGKAGKAGKRRRVVGPVAGSVARRVAVRAAGNLFDQVLASG